MANKPVLHRRDHEHGGADPVRIVWESTGEAGAGGAVFIPRVEELQANELDTAHVLDSTTGRAYVLWEDNVEWTYTDGAPLIFVDPGDARVVAVPIDDVTGSAIYHVTWTCYGLREWDGTSPESRFVYLKGWSSYGEPGAWHAFPGSPEIAGSGSSKYVGLVSSDGLGCVPTSSGSSNIAHWFSFYVAFLNPGYPYASLTFEVQQMLGGDEGNYVSDQFSQLVVNRVKEPISG